MVCKFHKNQEKVFCKIIKMDGEWYFPGHSFLTLPFFKVSMWMFWKHIYVFISCSEGWGSQNIQYLMPLAKHICVSLKYFNFWSNHRHCFGKIFGVHFFRHPYHLIIPNILDVALINPGCSVIYLCALSCQTLWWFPLVW